MSFNKNIALTALELVDDGFIPPQKPACAHFVSEVIKQAGWTGEINNPGWVPSLVEQSEPVTEPQPGDLVIFKQTYDAVNPAGIGPEDDYTHVGIIVGKGPGGSVTFAHYSAGRDKAVVDLLDDWWQAHVQEYRCWPTPQEDTQEEPGIILTEEKSSENDEERVTKLLKIFYHPGKGPAIVIDGNTETAGEIYLYVRTLSGKEIALTSHPFEVCPVLSIDGLYHPVRYVGSRGVEFLSRDLHG